MTPEKKEPRQGIDRQLERNADEILETAGEPLCRDSNVHGGKPALHEPASRDWRELGLIPLPATRDRAYKWRDRIPPVRTPRRVGYLNHVDGVAMVEWFTLNEPGLHLWVELDKPLPPVGPPVLRERTSGRRKRGYRAPTMGAAKNYREVPKPPEVLQNIHARRTADRDTLEPPGAFECNVCQCEPCVCYIPERFELPKPTVTYTGWNKRATIRERLHPWQPVLKADRRLQQHTHLEYVACAAEIKVLMVELDATQKEVALAMEIDQNKLSRLLRTADATA